MSTSLVVEDRVCGAVRTTIVQDPLGFQLQVFVKDRPYATRTYAVRAGAVADAKADAAKYRGEGWDGETYSADPCCADRTWHHTGTWCFKCGGWA